MSKLLLLSIVIAMIVMPIVVAREPEQSRGLRKLVLFTIALNVLYLIAVRFIYPRLQ